VPGARPGGGPDPDRLLVELRRAGGAEGAAPLAIGVATASDRPWPVGPAITAVRRAALRLIAPSLADLLVQLERDRRRNERRIDELTERVTRLEGERED
jgi:hypothetical protein